jgi:hypothetical protein
MVSAVPGFASRLGKDCPSLRAEGEAIHNLARDLNGFVATAPRNDVGGEFLAQSFRSTLYKHAQQARAARRAQ